MGGRKQNRIDTTASCPENTVGPQHPDQAMKRRRLSSSALCLPYLPALVAALLFANPSLTPAAEANLGIFTTHADVGQPAKAGSLAYDRDRQEYSITGSGANMWFGRDEFHFAYRRLQGDFLLRTRARFVGEGVDPHRKMGWMIRTDLSAGSPHVNASVHGDGLTSLQYRRQPGGNTEEVRSELSGAEVIQLERKGNTYTMSVARYGETFTATSVTDVELGNAVYVGLCVCAHNAAVLEQAVFGNVRVVIPPPAGYRPYRDYIGSNLEILDVVTGHRMIVHQTGDSLQAPNWTPDDRALIYNRNGLLYRFTLANQELEVIDTGTCNANNNDHVLSFDGRWLGISHHLREADRQSIVYVVPAEGGTPRRVTELGPSYFHGWSPDGQHLLYTGERNGDYDIYRMPVGGGDEVRLTSTPGLDDGSEYSPDGRYIYFNSVRSGTMQLWRMRPDGSQPEQLTDDGFNNWFPHVSPDGQSIAFLSFSGDVDPGDHPFYQKVYLRLMPAGGGQPKVIAYVFGGQGTINVPSWAPDSRRLAFVSNSGTP